jgi:pyruvate dehydrogenase E1 component alpha subunit
MALARALDERMVALQREGSILAHSSALGEEAAIVGATAAMQDDDWVFASQRELAAALWRGMPLSACAHRAFGTAHDGGRGRNAPGMPFWKPANVVTSSPLIGTQIPHAVGMAWAARARGEDRVALVFFGDGATSTGDFHSGMNFAGVLRAPVVALCRNNGWAMSTPASVQTASEGFAIKATAYGLRGERVDGRDVIAVLRVVREARARAARGEGGTLVEAITAAASEASDGASPEADPVARMRAFLEARTLWSSEREERLRSDARAEIDQAIEEARRATMPARDTMFEDVYAEMPWHLLEQRDRGWHGA